MKDTLEQIASRYINAQKDGRTAVRLTSRAAHRWIMENNPSTTVDIGKLLRASCEAVALAEWGKSPRMSFFPDGGRDWIGALPWAKPEGIAYQDALAWMAQGRYTISKPILALLLAQAEAGTLPDPHRTVLLQYKKHIPAIVKESQAGISSAMWPDQRGRMYSDTRGVSWQGAKVWSACSTYCEPYAVNPADMIPCFEYFDGKAISANPHPQEIAEAYSLAEATTRGKTSFIHHVDMSASGALFVAAMTGDERMYNDYLSGDFYSQIGQWLSPRARAKMDKKLYRTLCKRVIMLSLYNVTGGGLFSSMEENDYEAFMAFVMRSGRRLSRSVQPLSMSFSHID